MKVDQQTSATVPFERDELEGSLIARFDRIVSMFPDRIAASDGQTSWTYAELDLRSDQLAQAILKKLTPGRGCIAYVARHSVDMILCALAVLKAGRPYFCIHRSLPVAAQREIMQEAAPELLLCDAVHESMADTLLENQDLILSLSKVDFDAPVDAQIDALGVAIAPTDPALIFYTSGSTGKPRGIYKSQRVVLHRAWLAAQYDFVGPGDHQSLLTYCSFASSEADMFGALLNGATLELFDLVSGGLMEFGNWIDARRISVLHPPVVLFRHYLATLQKAECHPSVRVVALAGEAVTAGDIESWRKYFSGRCSLRHRFSSTEAGHVAVACIEPGDAISPGSVPGAKPVTDKYFDIIDEVGQPVPPGQVGELVVRSEFLADGFWRNDVETAQVFRVDLDNPAQRVFKTGDLGRILQDGTFEFVGRRDDQVKVRGYRVEIREIEKALCSIEGVKESAVVVEKMLDENRLVACVVMKAGQAFNESSLRASLRAILPEWKVPQRMYAVDTLPLTLTGKIDRPLLLRSLPKESNSEVVETQLQPLTEIWRKILERNDIGPDDDFFDLGGHSLKAAQLMQQIHRRFGPMLQPSALIAAPTIRTLWDQISTSSKINSAVDSQFDLPVRLKEGKGGTPLFCTAIARASAMTYLPMARLLDDHHPVYAMQFREIEDNPNESVEKMAARFILQMKRIAPVGPYRLCGHSFAATLAFEMAVLLVQSGDEVEFLGMLDGYAPGPRKPLPLKARLRRFKKWLLSVASIPSIIRRIKQFSASLGSANRIEQARSAAIDNNLRLRDSAFRHYQPKPYQGKITLLQATELLVWLTPLRPQPFNGWDEFCGTIDRCVVPGDHLSIIREPHVKAVASILNESLSALTSKGA